MVKQPEQKAALSRCVDDDAAGSPVVGHLHCLAHEIGVNPDAIGFARDRQEEPRLAPSIWLEIRLAYGSVFATDIEIRLQRPTQGAHEILACLALGAVERGFARLAIRGCREQRVRGDLHGICIKAVESEDKPVDLPPRLPRFMLKPLCEAADAGLGRIW